MNNMEEILENNRSDRPDKLAEFSEADKGGLIEKIKITRARVESKKQALEEAIGEGKPADVIEVLALELQQNTMVLKDLEENLASI